MQKFSCVPSIMDTSASPETGADNKEVYGFFLKIDGGRYSTPSYQKNTVIKYTKLPDFDFETKVSWPNIQSYTLQPRLRRIISLGDDDFRTNRSLRSIAVATPKAMAANRTNRKVVTISEDDEHGVYPTFTKVKRPTSIKMTNRSIETDYKLEKPASNRTTSRLTNTAKYTKEIKASAKVSAYNKKEVNVNQQQNYKAKTQPVLSSENTRTKHVRDKDISRNSRSANQSKSSVSRNLVTPSESVKELTRIKNILYDNLKTNTNCKKPIEKPRLNQSPPSSSNKNKINLKNISSSKSKQVTIRVPLDEKYVKPKVTANKSKNTLKIETTKLNSTDRGLNTDPVIQYTHVNIGTEPVKSVDQMTDIDDLEIITLCRRESTVQTESIKETFDSLEIPNVTLTKERPEIKKEIVNVLSTPIIQVPLIETSHKEEISSSDISFCQSAYVFSRATVTYTSRQKINFHIVDSDERISPNIPPSPLEYPINVVSVFKNELKNREKSSKNNINSEEKKVNKEYLNCLNELNSLNCSYVINKLIKPSDIISTIRVNNGLLQNDYICEQFQRELNFIDSFFESLQYLEGCSLSDKCLSENKVESLVNNSVLFDSTFDVKNSEYDNFLSKLENGANVDDAETMASKSLCLLNLLIRDEQRRAKNLLFVLKMREDALKDFTKSQILWLEKKKKQDNTDISTLKKKQRGALLKLQHECGEMQRMRKALLTLSEKRKLALMKTKKNIELKLKNNVDVDNIILGKKKLKRSSSGDRNASPLKCFDLSSSGCEDSTASRQTSESAAVIQETGTLTNLRSVEKCVQTGDVSCSYTKHHETDIAPENFIAVDGGYLNILFRDLMLPQIFSNGKQYEVNEEALKNIVISTNNQSNNLSGSEVVEKLMEQIKNRDLDTSSPSTARSLVEEFDQYYRDLTADDNFTADSPERDRESSTKKVFELRDACVQSDFNFEPIENSTNRTSVIPCSDETVLNNDVMLSEGDKSCVCEPVNLDSVCLVDKEPILCGSQTQTGPLPVPVGAVADDASPPYVPVWAPSKSSTSSSSDTDSEVSLYTENQSVSSLISLSTPVQCEAEELRRQQLAIEREIKALEQQQCRLLVVREIPDKPPPPYTPPTETKPKPPRLFALDENSTKKIESYIAEPSSVIEAEIQDAFDVFLKDYCEESLERHQQEQSDKPWDSCNLLPKKPQVDTQKIIHNTAREAKEILTGIQPTNVSGVSSRRSDHIDDILFAEWRRCEPEWTALHTDEAIVKNQLFDSIFQKILTETIDDYKKTVTANEITAD